MALELRALHQGVYPLDKGRIETLHDQLTGGVPLVYQQVQQLVHLYVGETQFAFVRLPFPEIGTGGLVENGLGHTERSRQLAHLRLVQVADRVQGAGHVAPECAVAQQQLRLVAGADDEGLKCLGLIVDGDHARARHDVAAALGGQLLFPIGIGFDHRRNLEDAVVNAECRHHPMRVTETGRVAGTIGQHDCPHAVRPQRSDRQVGRQRRINAPGQRHHYALVPDLGNLLPDEPVQQARRQLDVEAHPLIRPRCQRRRHGEGARSGFVGADSHGRS